MEAKSFSRTAIAEEIRQKIAAFGGRFLKVQDGSVYELTKKEARAKIGKCIRDMTKPSRYTNPRKLEQAIPVRAEPALQVPTMDESKTLKAPMLRGQRSLASDEASFASDVLIATKVQESLDPKSAKALLSKHMDWIGDNCRSCDVLSCPGNRFPLQGKIYSLLSVQRGLVLLTCFCSTSRRQ